MDEDLLSMTPEQLLEEVRELWWHHPQLWGLLPERSDPLQSAPEWPQFLRGCVRYRESLDRELPGAPRTTAELEPDE